MRLKKKNSPHKKKKIEATEISLSRKFRTENIEMRKEKEED